MTEPLVTITPKTSPYRSQIQTRIASPRSLSSINIYVSPANNRNLDDHLLSNERSQLRKLNDQFLSYIERVRLCETYNNCLTLHCEHIKNAQERTKDKLDLLKKEFEEYQHERFNRENKDIELENEHNDDMEKQVNEYKNRKNFLQHEHELNRHQIIDMQQQSIDIQAKTEKLRLEHENVNDDKNHYRKQVTYYQILKSSILDEISRQRNAHQNLQIEVEDLRSQKQLSIQAYEADTQAIEIQNDNIFYDLASQFRLDGNEKSILKQTLNEIREEYKIKDNQMREELHRKYLFEYNQHKKKLIDRNFIETNRESIERNHLSNELNSLNDNRSLLRQKLTLIKEHYKQLEINFQRELKRQKDTQEKYDNEIRKLNVSVQEYENLLNQNPLTKKSTIEDEVKKYRQLLEGSDQHLGLRQIVNMPNKIDRSSPIHYSAIASTESIRTVLPPTSPIRQHSTSDTSYATAPISTTTNQQYLTLDSINEKGFPNEYDTDNDQSQTIQCVSGRNSRLINETDLSSTNQDISKTMDFTKHDETINEVSINISHHEFPINQTLPFIPMNIVSPTGLDGNKTIITDEQQSPLISTLENRDEREQTSIEPSVITPSEIIIPVTIDIDIDSTINEELNEAKIISPSASIIRDDERTKSMISPTPVLDHPVHESTLVEVPISSLPAENPLAKLMLQMLPDAAPFVPSSNVTSNQSGTAIPILTMNNDAPPFIPSQNQHGINQTHMNNAGSGHWNGRGGQGGNNNRRGQNSGGGFHHGGGGNQRSGGGGGGNWQQPGGNHHKQRRGQK